MEKVAFCTIITADYLHYALALNESLIRYQKEVPFYIFVSNQSKLTTEWEEFFPNIHFLYPEDLCKEGVGKAIYEKYHNNYMDGFRWSMKGVLLTYLLETLAYDKGIILDCDLYFYNDFQFLWKELDHSNVLITPHWRCAIHPQKNPGAFDHLFTQGLYNAGFVGANKAGIPVMLQWAKWNLYQCEINADKAIYVDQTYLNLFPIYFDKIKVIKHKGCNVAIWNQEECKRVKVGEEVLINGKDPIIFIHFVKHTVWSIVKKGDPLLKPHLDSFYTSLKKFNPAYNFEKHYQLIEEMEFDFRFRTYLKSMAVVRHLERKWKINIPKPIKLVLEFVHRRKIRKYYKRNPDKFKCKFQAPNLVS